MGRVVYVTPAEVKAARTTVERMRKSGQTPPPAFVRVAEARQFTRDDMREHSRVAAANGQVKSEARSDADGENAPEQLSSAPHPGPGQPAL